MPRIFTAALAALFVAASSHAVGQTQRRARGIRLPQLGGEKKLQYIAQQLTLTPEQEEQFDTLIVEVYRPAVEAGKKALQDMGDRARDLYAERVKAQQEGDEEKLKELDAHIQGLNPVYRGENEFFKAIEEQLLTPEQVALLGQAQARLKRNASGLLLPAEVFRLARQTGLTPDQVRKLEELRVQYRQRIFREVAPNDVYGRIALRENLIREVRELLTPEQQEAFDRQIKALRVESVVRTSTTDKQSTPDDKSAPGDEKDE